MNTLLAGRLRRQKSCGICRSCARSPPTGSSFRH